MDYTKKLVLVFSSEGQTFSKEIELKTEGEVPCDSANPNSRGKSPPTFTEKQFEKKYGSEYDQPKEAEAGLIDEEHAPYRHLKYWFLYSKKKPNKRLPLPIKNSLIPKEYVLAGWLQPPPPDTFIGVDQQLEPLFVVIDGEKTLQFDHTANCRGYWISTGQNEEQKVYYWLQEPCDVRPPCPDDKSQADMHFDARVVLAVVSLLCDKIFSVHTALDYVGKPIEQVLQEKPLVRLKDPTGKFERRLLAKYQSAVSVFLNGHLVELNRKCTFMKSLAKLTPENTLLKKEQILKWTLTAEKQSGRYSWGGLLPNQENHGEQDFVISGDREVVRNVLRSVPLLGLKGDATSAEQLLIAADEQVQNAFQRNGEDDKESSNSESGSLEDSDAESDSTEPPKKKRKSSDEKGKAAKQRPRPQSDVVGKKGGTSSKSKHSSTTATTGKNQQKRSQPEMSTIDENENLSSKNPAAKKSKKTTKHVAEEVGNENLLMYSIGRMEIVMGSFRDREYLISAPQAIAGYSWEGVQTMEFTLSTDLTTANSFFLEILNCKDESKGLEWALLAVEVLNKSFQALEAGTKPELSGILQLMFKKPEFMHRWPAVVVYQDFRNQALKILNRRLSQQKACAGTTAMHLLISTLKLIIGCEFINRPTQLDKMKKNGVDWELGIQQIRNFSSKLRLGDSELLKNFLTMADEKVRLVKEGYKPATKENCTSPTSRPTSHPTAKDKGKRGIGSSLNSLLSKCGKANATQAISATPEDLYSSSVPKKITAKVRHLQNGGTGIQYCSRDLGVASSAAPRTDARRNENCEWLTKKVVTGWGNATDVAIRYGEIKTEALASGHATIQSFPTHSEGTGTTTGQSLDQGKSCVSEGMDDLKPSARVQMHDVPVRRHQGAHHVGRPSQPLISIGRGRHMTEPSWTTKGRENPTV